MEVTMTEAIVNTQNSEIKINYISHLLDQLTVGYQSTKAERKLIAELSPVSEEEFTVLEEIELLTVDIRGYASQIEVQGCVKNEQEAIERLENMRIFDISAIAQFYFATNGDFPQMKAYIRMLDYLRLLTIEYLRSHFRTIK